jgi:hypothetical protein
MRVSPDRHRWQGVRRWLAIVGAAGVCASASLAAAAEFVVLKSTAEHLQPGQRLDGSEEVRVPAGTALTAISDSGAVRTIEGPFAGTLDVGEEAPVPAAREVLDVVAALITEGEQEAALAAARGNVADGAWVADAGKAGSYCAKADGKLSLRRSPTLPHVELVLVSTQTGEYAPLHWSGAADVQPWPKGVTAISGTRYRWIAPDRADDTDFTLWIAPAAELDDPLPLAMWLAERGCRDQARRLLVSLR